MPADSVSIRIYSGIARFPCDSMAFLLRLSFRLLVLAQVWILSNSSVRESMLLAGITRQVSSAYLQNLLPGVKGIRSPALTTYETGPTAEPWIMLADIFSKGEI